ncbi:MAG: MBL fold metallo-hydrolase [Bacteroidaceae bacterium]|nr:MBL fold metallo-hydrolase [Bacteroidaceae bacterium]
MNHIINKFLNSITYIIPIKDSKECYLVDCGDIEEIVEHGWQVKGVFLTHCHFDHIYGINKLIKYYPDAMIYTNEEGRNGLVNPRVNFSKYHDEVEDFEFLYLENIRLIEKEILMSLADDLIVKVLLTPGHDSSCISYIIGNYLFTGDAYIPGIKTVTTFPRSNKKQASESLVRLQKIENKYGYIICAGHPNKIKD